MDRSSGIKTAPLLPNTCYLTLKLIMWIFYCWLICCSDATGVCLFAHWCLGFVLFYFILSYISKAHTSVQLGKTEHSRNRQGNPVWDWNLATSNPYMDNLVYSHFPSSPNQLPLPDLNCPGIHMFLSIPLGTRLQLLSSQPARATLQLKFTLVPCREKRVTFLVITSVCSFPVIFLCDFGKVHCVSYHKENMVHKLSRYGSLGSQKKKKILRYMKDYLLMIWPLLKS